MPATASAHQRYYVDLFAGPGRNRVEETGQVIGGSPLIAIKAGLPAFTELFLVDAEPRNVRSLEAHRHDHPDRQITIHDGDANRRVDDILRVLPRQFPVFAFLDPRGAELEWRTITRLAAHKATGRPKIELFILFAYNQGLARLLPYDPSKMGKRGRARPSDAG